MDREPAISGRVQAEEVGDWSAAPEGAAVGAGWRRGVLPALACALVGAAVATLPHAGCWLRAGDPTWVADHDDLFYLALGSRAYFDPLGGLGDPVVASGGASIYRPLPLLPGALAARLLGLGPAGIGLAWRVWGGLTVGIATFLLVGHHTRRRWLAAALAAVVMVDCGQVEGRPLLRPLTVAARVAAGRPGDLFDRKPLIHTEWRIATPALTQAYLLLALWLLARARDRPSRARLTLSGVGFGLLFYVYFFYWTAFGLGLLMGLAVDAGRRRVYWYTTWIGGLVGLPALVADAVLKLSTAPDWLLRTNKFVPIGRFSELLIPKGAVLLAAVALAWTWWRRRDLLPLGLMVVAGLALANHQVVTGLQIENFHWCYVWGPCLSLLLVLSLAGAATTPVGARRIATALAWASGGLLVALGFGLRAVEAAHTAESRIIVADYHRYRAQRLASAAERLEPRGTVAGDPAFVELAVVLENQRPLAGYAVVLSPAVDDVELLGRQALNSLLLGRSRAAFEAEQRAALERDVWGPWAAFREPAANSARLRAQVAAYDAVAADPAAWCKRFAVRYLALPAGPAATPGPGWHTLQDGPSWRLWRRTDDGPVAFHID